MIFKTFKIKKIWQINKYQEKYKIFLKITNVIIIIIKISSLYIKINLIFNYWKNKLKKQKINILLLRI